MISWYIDSSNNNEVYLKKVNEVIEPCMNWLEKRLYELYNDNKHFDHEYDEYNKIGILLSEIIEEIPILKFCYGININDPEIYLRYNSSTIIRFNDGLKGLIREIRLNKILGIEFEK